MHLMEIIENSELQPQNLTVEELFRVVLYELGFSFKIQGTQYLEELFALAYEKYDNACYIRITDLCDIIGEKHDTIGKNVFRSISYSITVAWNKGNTRLQNELFGYTVDAQKGKPTLQEFVCLMFELLKL